MYLLLGVAANLDKCTDRTSPKGVVRMPAYPEAELATLSFHTGSPHAIVTCFCSETELPSRAVLLGVVVAKKRIGGCECPPSHSVNTETSCNPTRPTHTPKVYVGTARRGAENERFAMHQSH
jgi:hypothetical protein